MKIEKGKLYYNGIRLYKASMDYDDNSGFITNNIAVHCITKEDWDYVVSNGYNLTSEWYEDSNYGLYIGTFACSKKDYHIITIDQFKEFYPPQIDQDEYSWVNNGLQGVPVKKTFNPQPYYDNSKGSLYKVATERGWSSYIFDVVKRLERGGKKDPLRQEIEKSIDVLKVWLQDIERL